MGEVGLHTENIRLGEEDKTCLVKESWRTGCDSGGGGGGGRGSILGRSNQTVLHGEESWGMMMTFIGTVTAIGSPTYGYGLCSYRSARPRSRCIKSEGLNT